MAKFIQKTFPRGCEMAPVGIVDKVSKVFEWRIPHFFSLLEGKDKHVNSHSFSFAGEFWYLSIFLDGRQADKEPVRCIGITLARYCSGPAINLDYSLSLKTSKGEIVNELHHQKSFTKSRVAAGSFRHISKDELSARKSELLPSDILTVLCTIKYTKSIGNKSKSFSNTLTNS